MMATFRRDYFVRLTTLAALVLAALIVVHGVLLAPTYIFLETQIQGRTARLQDITKSLNTSEEQQVNERLAHLEDNIAYLQKLDHAPSAARALDALLSVSRPGIHISGFTYTAPDATGSTHATLTGVADTRETLRAYVLALQQEPLITNADLPVSAYAKDRDIAFTITLAGSFTP